MARIPQKSLSRSSLHVKSKLASMGSVKQTPELDVILVGAGFASFSLMNRLRKQGLSCKILEKGPSSGGIWYSNCYPGARVDTHTPIYQFFDKELWQDFTFKEKYPGRKELMRYFTYVEEKWQLKRDIEYNMRVDGAEFDETRRQWLIDCSDGTEFYCRWFIPCVGFASKQYRPPVKNLGGFEGEVYHTATWPQHSVSMKGKRIAIIGTGASGIQVAQTIGPVAEHLTIFQRTPNLCLPMRQKLLDAEEEQKLKASGMYKEAFAKTYTTFAGSTMTFQDRSTFDDTPEERRAFYTELWNEGGFGFWLNNYADTYKSLTANDEAYKFWREKVLERITDIKKADILAPAQAPHPFGTKRPSLEQNFYEVVSADNVDIVDINKTPLLQVEERGLRTSEGLVDIDCLILATGFDTIGGSLGQLNIRGSTGGTIAEHWKDGCRTAMGIAIPSFPNLFFLYGPQAPTAFSNGPTCVNIQAEWVESTIEKLAAAHITRFEAKVETEQDWYQRMEAEWSDSLFPLANSWFQGANIPGRKVEPLYWSGGIPKYIEALKKSMENDFQGWIYKTSNE